MEKLKSKKIIQGVLRRSSLSDLLYPVDNQTISDDYLNKNFKAIYRSFSSVG